MRGAKRSAAAPLARMVGGRKSARACRSALPLPSPPLPAPLAHPKSQNTCSLSLTHSHAHTHMHAPTFLSAKMTSMSAMGMSWKHFMWMLRRCRISRCRWSTGRWMAGSLCACSRGVGVWGQASGCGGIMHICVCVRASTHMAPSGLCALPQDRRTSFCTVATPCACLEQPQPRILPLATCNSHLLQPPHLRPGPPPPPSPARTFFLWSTLARYSTTTSLKAGSCSLSFLG